MAEGIDAIPITEMERMTTRAAREGAPSPEVWSSSWPIDGSTVGRVTDDLAPISVAEIEQMTPSERQAAFDARVVTDLSTLDPELLTEIRRRARQLLEEHGVVPTSER